MQKEQLERRLVGVVKVRNHKVTWASAAFAQMMGYDSAELAGLPTRIFYEDDASFDEFWHGARDALNRGEAFGGKVRRVRKDGSVGWFEVNCFRREPEVDEHETTLVDISDKQAAIEALAQSEARLREAQRIAQLGSWEVDRVAGDRVANDRVANDRVGGGVAWSDEMFRIFGRNPRVEQPSLDVYAAIAHLRVHGGVHRGEQFVAKLVEDAVYVQIRHTPTIPELWDHRLTESRNPRSASDSAQEKFHGI